MASAESSTLTAVAIFDEKQDLIIWEIQNSGRIVKLLLSTRTGMGFVPTAIATLSLDIGNIREFAKST